MKVQRRCSPRRKFMLEECIWQHQKALHWRRTYNSKKTDSARYWCGYHEGACEVLVLCLGYAVADGLIKASHELALILNKEYKKKK